MTSARNAIHKAIKTRLEGLGLGMPVRTSLTTTDLPYVRLDGDRENPSGVAKDGVATVVRYDIAIFGDQVSTVRTASETIVNDVTVDPPPLAPSGFRLMGRIEARTRSVTEEYENRTIDGDRIELTIYAEPSA